MSKRLGGIIGCNVTSIYVRVQSIDQSRMVTRDGTAEPVSRDQILRRERGQGNINFPYSADHEQDWHPYLVDPYSCYMCDNTYIHVNLCESSINRSIKDGDAGRDCRTRLARPNSQARTRTRKY